MDGNEQLGNTPDGPPPIKKRKTMHAPEGFQSLKRLPGKANIPTRKFASAFDDPRRSKFATKDSPLRVPRLSAPPPATPRAGPSKEPPLCVLRPPALPTLNLVHPGPSRGGSPIASGSRSTTALRMGSTTKFTLGADGDSPEARKPVFKGRLQKLQVPVPPPLPEPVKPSRPLHVMKPPPVPYPPKKGSTLAGVGELKSISTTRLAVAMNPQTESGIDELVALQLEQNAPSYVPPGERELHRGLDQSPEKASKAKTAKFSRGGLAERAKYLFREQHTALALWYKDMELQASRPQTHTRVAADLYLRIVRVLHVASIVSLQRSQNVPRLCVVRCAKVIKGRTTGDLTVLLDFGGPSSLAGKAHTLDEIKEGKDVHVWRPWNSSQVDEEEMRRHGAPPRDGSTLFCTRFRIV